MQEDFEFVRGSIKWRLWVMSQNIVQYCWGRYRYNVWRDKTSLSDEVPGRATGICFQFWFWWCQTSLPTIRSLWTAQCSQVTRFLLFQTIRSTHLWKCMLSSSCHSHLSVSTTWFLLGVASFALIASNLVLNQQPSYNNSAGELPVVMCGVTRYCIRNQHSCLQQCLF